MTMTTTSTATLNSDPPMEQPVSSTTTTVEPIRRSQNTNDSTMEDDACDEEEQQQEEESWRTIMMNQSLLDEDDDDEEDEGTDEKQANVSSSNNDSQDKENQNHHANDNNDKNSNAVDVNRLFATQLVTQPTKNNNKNHVKNTILNQRWDGFVRKGTRLKTLFEDAMTEVHQQYLLQKKKRKQNPIFEEEQSQSQTELQTQTLSTVQHAAKLALAKTTQIGHLERQLHDAQAQAAALRAANASLRDETAATQSRLEKTTHALKIAGSNAARARADADAAEATAASLATSLQALQTVIAETKRAAQILHEEQQELSKTTKQVEAQLVQKQSELVRAQTALEQLRKQQARYDGSQEQWKLQRQTLQAQIDSLNDTVQDLQRRNAEQTALEQARKDRADKIEAEWRRAQTLLVEATAGQAAAEHTQATLQQTIRNLEASNAQVHEQLAHIQKHAAEERQKLARALEQAEKQAQSLKITAESFQEELERYKMDKKQAEQTIQNLKSKLWQLEQQQQVAATNTTTTATTMHVSPDPNGNYSTTMNKTMTFSLPPLNNSNKTPNPKDNDTSSITTSHMTPGYSSNSTCCICFKEAFGMMKKCQCGNPKCRKRAHILCVSQCAITPSVSHPGTPGPKLPVILCGNSGNGGTGMPSWVATAASSNAASSGSNH